MLRISIICIVVLLVQFIAYGQMDDKFKDVDSLLKIVQPNAAQAEWWKIIRTAQDENDSKTMIKGYTYLGDFVNIMSYEERGDLFYKVTKLTSHFPEPALSLNRLKLIQELTINPYSWFNGKLEKDTLNLSDREQRISYVISQMEQLTEAIEPLNATIKFNFEEYRKALKLDDKEDISMFHTIGDYLAYMLIAIYQSNNLLLYSELKNAKEIEENWFATPDVFTTLTLENDNLTTRILRLFQKIEQNNSGNSKFESSSVFLRWKYLTTEQQTAPWQKGYDYYKASDSRSKFLVEIAKKMIDEGKKYHYKTNPSVETKIKEAYDLIASELVAFLNNESYNLLKELSTEIKSAKAQISLSPQQAPHLSIPINVSYQNLNRVYLTIFKIKDYPSTNINTLKIRQLLATDNLFFVRKKMVELPNKELFQNRDLELMLEPLEEGGYFVVATKTDLDLPELSKNDSAWNNAEIKSVLLNISSIAAAFQYNQITNKTKVIVTDFLTGKPIKNAEVSIYVHRYYNETPTLLKKSNTDADGIVSVKNNESSAIIYEVNYGKSHLYSSEYQYTNTKAGASRRIHVITDRNIYRPGQTVYFKGIVYEGKDIDFKVSPKKEIEVLIRDASFQTIYKQKFITNSFGSIEGSFELPTNTNLGLFEIKMEVESNDLASGTNFSYFSVEEYKRPTYSIELIPPKEEAKLNDTVTIKGKTQSFAGYPIANANVQFSVYRNISQYWRWFRSATGDLLKAGEITTDDKGLFSIKFFAETDPNQVPWAYYTYEVVAKVTDLTGETHEESISLYLSKKGLVLQMDVPSQIISTEESKAKLTVVNLFQELQTGYEGIIEVYKVTPNDEFLPRIWKNPEYSFVDEKEFKKLFPYSKQDAYKENEERMMLSKKIPFKSGEELKMNDWFKEQGQFKLVAKIITENDTLETTSTIEYIDVNGKKPPTPLPLWTFISSTERKVGESVDFQVGSSFKHAKAYLIVYNAQRIIKEKWIDLDQRFRYYYTITEGDRGAVKFGVTLFQNGKSYYSEKEVRIPFDNKELIISTSVFRDKLTPGQQETWKFTVKDKDSAFVSGELAATMYDISLDQLFGTYYWNWDIYYRYTYLNNWSWMTNTDLTHFGFDFYKYYSRLNDPYDWFKSSLFRGNMYKSTGIGRRATMREKINSEEIYANLEYDMAMSPVSTAEQNEPVTVEISNGKDKNTAEENGSKSEGNEQKIFNPRTDFKETAFFYPMIYADKNNEYVLNFTLPESLTQWKLMLLAHDKSMLIGNYEKTIVAQKEVMITANAPRFVREGDTFEFVAKVVNLTQKEQTVEVDLMLRNPENQEELKLAVGTTKQMITIPSNGTKEVSWHLEIDERDLIEYTVSASNSSFSDGERNVLPVLSNRILVTESKHKIITKTGKTEVDFKAFEKQQSSTLRAVSYTVQYTDNLAWNAVIALPYLAQKEDQSSTTLANNYYANAIAKDIVDKNPKIKQIFDLWKVKSPDVLLSELEKNESLKNIVLKETPWVMDAKNESEQRRRIAQLFEINQLANNQTQLFNEIKRRQNSDGGFSWFEGGKSSRYITQVVLTRFGQLKNLGIDISFANSVLNRADQFVANEQVKYFKKYKDKKDWKKEYHLSNLDIYWLYTRSLLAFNHSKDIDEVTTFYKEKLKQEWKKEYNPYGQAMIGIYFKNEKMDREANLIYASLLDRAKTNDLGMYWIENSGYFWYSDKIATQAMIIHFFKEMSAPEKTMDNARLWLLLNKETKAWGSTTSTAEAIYAILSTGKEYLKETPAPKLKVGQKEVIFSGDASYDKIKSEWTPGLGQTEIRLSGNEITKDMRNILIEKPYDNPSALSIFWSYTELLAHITESQNSSVSVTKKYFKIVNGPKKEIGEETLHFKRGDKIEIELTITVDRDLEFVHLRDLRPAGFELLDAISGYQMKEGLWFYQSPKDASMEFFIDLLPQGTYTVKYQAFATHSGTFNSGTASLQSYYAPGFGGNSGTVEVVVK